MIGRMKTKLLFIFAAILVTTHVFANEEPIQVRSFLTFTGVGTDTDAQFNDGSSKEFGFSRLSKIGLLISKGLSSDLDASVLILAKGYSATPFNQNVEWAQVTWHPTDTYQIRLGKQVYGTFLISDYLEVGGAYPWIRPPQQVYEMMPFRSISGITIQSPMELMGGKLETSLTYGTISADIYNDVVTYRTTTPVSSGLGVAKWTKDDFTARAAYAQAHAAAITAQGITTTDLSTYIPVPGAGGTPTYPAGSIVLPIPFRQEIKFGDCSYASVGFQQDSEYIFYGEWAAMKCPDSSQLKIIEGSYYTFGKHFSDRKYLAHLTYSFSNLADGALIGGRSYSTTAGLNQNIGTNMILKYELGSHYFQDLTSISLQASPAIPSNKKTVITSAVSLVAEF